MESISFIINNPIGLHARPAAAFVQLTNQYQSEILVSYNGRTVNAKSILGVLSLGAGHGAEIILSVEGTDKDEALLSITEFMEKGIAEE